jgi:hypothetical protein
MQTTEPLNGGAPNTYAFGNIVESYRGERLVQHAGATGGYRAALFRFPDKHTSVAMMCNVATANTEALSLRMADIVLASSLGARVAEAAPPRAAGSAGRAGGTIPVAERRSIVGRYRSSELNDATWEVKLANDSSSLELVRPRNRPMPLISTDSAYAYVAAGFVTLKFAAPSKGKSGGFVLNGSRVSAVRFERISP